jgi:hypothetical protein
MHDENRDKREMWLHDSDLDLTFEKFLKKVEQGVSQRKMSEVVGKLLAIKMLQPRSIRIAKIQNGTTLRIDIDFSEINSFDELKDFLGLLIDEQFSIMSAMGLLPDRCSQRKKVNQRNFERIIEAGDSYEELKKKNSRGIYRQIAEKIFPRSTYPNYHYTYGEGVKIRPPIKKSAIDETERIVKEYERFVMGGYQEIVYP